ncbi:NAD(P)/FAD-dependent oxidoreductase [Microlunatus spumicola]|uniref:NAD(P)/FAD-dependent oxidoreductase n=1 Tax=Microlunatus spumicola TaxID=81499 RepID=A0ABP6X740_9ACTN
MTQLLEADHLVVGAGAAGLAFVDALVEHDPQARVVLVDRRDGVGGHWRGAYPFVRLHQSSTYYGVASTLLGDDRRQTEGPEAGLHERADQPTILAYYEQVLADRLLASGRVRFFPRSEHVGGRTFVSLDSGERHEVPERCRVVDARYLSPDIPAETPPPFAVDGARVVPAGGIPAAGPTRQHVVVGSGKTATDSVVWLLQHGVDPDAICWVRPRDPWMLDRANLEPDPVVYLGMVAGLMGLASEATSLPGLFLDLEEAGTMLRIDRTVTPTMAKVPTLGRWELDLLRSVEHVVRLGRVRAVRRGFVDLDEGTVAVADDALVVHCAADGLKRPPLVPIWRPDVITLQPVRAGFPCFGAALAGVVEATRDDDDEKNRVCRPSSLGGSLTDWARMNVRGFRAGAAFGAEPDLKAWSDRVALNPARVPPEAGSPELDVVLARLAAAVPAGVARLDELIAPA